MHRNFILAGLLLAVFIFTVLGQVQEPSAQITKSAATTAKLQNTIADLQACKENID